MLRSSSFSCLACRRTSLSSRCAAPREAAGTHHTGTTSIGRTTTPCHVQGYGHALSLSLPYTTSHAHGYYAHAHGQCLHTWAHEPCPWAMCTHMGWPWGGVRSAVCMHTSKPSVISCRRSWTSMHALDARSESHAASVMIPSKASFTCERGRGEGRGGHRAGSRRAGGERAG